VNKSSNEFHLIFEDGDPLRAEVVRSVLEAEEIDCFIENAGIQNLFSLGGMGGLNPLIGTAKVFIRTEDRARAEALLAQHQTSAVQEADSHESFELSPGASSEVSKSESKGFLFLLRRWFGK